MKFDDITKNRIEVTPGNTSWGYKGIFFKVKYNAFGEFKQILNSFKRKNSVNRDIYIHSAFFYFFVTAFLLFFFEYLINIFFRSKIGSRFENLKNIN